MNKIEALERAIAALDFSILEYEGTAFEDSEQAEKDRQAKKVLKKKLEDMR